MLALLLSSLYRSMRSKFCTTSRSGGPFGAPRHARFSAIARCVQAIQCRCEKRTYTIRQIYSYLSSCSKSQCLSTIPVRSTRLPVFLDDKTWAQDRFHFDAVRRRTNLLDNIASARSTGHTSQMYCAYSHLRKRDFRSSGNEAPII